MMAKKVRRARRRRSESKQEAAAASPPRNSEDELREEYAYVIQDLRRVAILAAAMFILLIALNLLLQ